MQPAVWRLLRRSPTVERGTPAGGNLHIGATLIAIAMMLFAVFHAFGWSLGGYPLGLGHVVVPQPGYVTFLLFFTVFSGVGIPALALGLSGLCSGRLVWRGWRERRFLITSGIAGVVLPTILRLFLLRGAPLTDDEAVYRFSAELLLSGRLSAPSHPLKLFFDQAFLINDGRMYTQYFLGWPAILAPGLLIGIGGYVNALLSGLTVPGLYLFAREFVTRRWAQVAVLIFLSSPMLQVAAATQLSYTSSLAALTWSGLFAMRAGRPSSSSWWHVALGLTYSVAFFIRPLSAVGIGVPFLVYWGVKVLGGPGERTRKVIALAAPCVLLAGLFLWVNFAQTGSPWKPAYVARFEYAAANDYRFSGMMAGQAHGIPNLRLGGAMLLIFPLSLFRLNFALFGWPTSFLFLPLAVGMRRTGVLWASMGWFAAVHLPLKDGGIDSFGPVHLIEMSLPILILTACGLQKLHRGFRRRAPVHRALPVTMLFGLLLASGLMYAPYRLRTLAELAAMTRRPAEASATLPPGQKLLFVPYPYARVCHPGRPATSRHFVFWWPLNDPDFRNEVLWANHLDVETDRILAEYYPDRDARILHWTEDCRLEFLRLDDPRVMGIPNGLMRFEDDAIVRFDPSHDPTGILPGEQVR